MNYKEAYFNRGRRLSVKGRYGEAIKEYRKALRIDPDYEQAEINLKLIIYLLDKEKRDRVKKGY